MGNFFKTAGQTFAMISLTIAMMIALEKWGYQALYLIPAAMAFMIVSACIVGFARGTIHGTRAAMREWKTDTAWSKSTAQVREYYPNPFKRIGFYLSLLRPAKS